MTPETRFDLSAVGELNLDLVLYGLPAEFELDREHLASDMRITLGSSSAIFAHNFALLGNRVGFNSAIGADPLGELCLARLAESGTDISGVREFAGRQTGLTVILPRPQKRYILTYPGVMAEMRFEDLNLEHIFQARHLHLSSFFLQRALRPRVAELFRRAKQAGLTTSLDTNDDPEDRWDNDVIEVLEFVDVLLPNEREACRLARREAPMEALGFLSEKCGLVVMKRGENGVTARRGSEVVTAAPMKTEVVDTIGAGDSFDAGFLHQFIRGRALNECLRFGNLTGALSTTKQGGTEAFRDAAHRDSFLQR
ncbi:MAG: carbohydrate kinase family protein [Acidobacteria bacterium]|nr:carbohydrate kinase family protein [Acidobacteriota bacterium]MBS1865152.1 carbohydrate kinase family protein [Acidobacteriota bacterium]